jgi:putative endonuclease
MLRCSDDSLYTGYTNDIQRRLKQHNRGKGAKYTRTRLPVELAYFEAHDSRRAAMKREWWIKHRLTRQQKLEMIEGI